jgi:GST-like protein
MIEVYAFATPIAFASRSCWRSWIPYDLKPVNVRKGDQKLPEHLALNPNGKVPHSLIPMVQAASAWC